MSIRFKMILGIGSILLLVIFVYALLALRTQATHLLNMSRREAELMAALVERAISRAMLEGRGEEVQATLERIGENPGLAGIRIVDPRGAILYSSKAAELGHTLTEPKKLVEGMGPVFDYSGQTTKIFRPIPNEPACYKCHAPNQRILGFLNVSVAFPSIDSELARQWTLMILLSVAALVVAGGLITLYFTLVLGRRLDAISQTMSRVEAGDLTGRVMESERDELGRLGKSFNAMVARLADARRQLESRHEAEIRRAEDLASLGKMAAGIAHEINNPLAGMENCVRTLLRGARDEGQRVQYLTMLKEGLDRIGRTVGQLLGFARESKPQFTRIELSPILRRSLALLEHEMASRKIPCSLSTDSGLPALLADPHQIEEVILNILMNAVEAMPDGGTLTVSTGLREEAAGPFIEIRVADTGVGIPSEQLPRIFDPFFTTKEVGKGTGLGLSVSYGIVRAHGGSIDVESELGKGTTFTVALPAGEEGDNHGSPHSPRGR